MNDHLKKVLTWIGNEYENEISTTSRFYREVDIGKQAEKIGYDDIRNQYKGVYAIVPLNHPESGMKVRIDGRTFIDYAQFDSGSSSRAMSPDRPACPTGRSSPTIA